jgi:NO-binding membrane sensor protein with MHYT domain/nitrogen-specific signal transduction histidine kinase
MTLTGYYVWPLVVISILVGFFASYTALSLAQRVSKSTGRTAYLWIGGGAIAMGTGIWSMHFIGMLAFRLPIAIGYDLWITALSLALPIAVSALALWQVSQPELPLRRLLLGALLMGVGINAMHYTGMAAMRVSPGLEYDPALVAVSLSIAIGASGVGLWIWFHLRRNLPQSWLLKVGAALAMGGAISGMHYTGMAAAQFDADSVCRAASGGFSQDGLSLLVIITTFSILAIALVTSELNARLELRAGILAAAQAAAVERQEILERERSARQASERLNDLKDEFLAVVSHELRTPLSAIMGWTDMLKRGIDDAAIRSKALETIGRNVKVQTRLIDDLLDMSKIMSDKVTLDLEPVDLAELLRSTMESIGPGATEKGVCLEEAFETQQVLISADRTRLLQVLGNLLTNAVKFTPAGGWVRVALQASEQKVRIVVSDSGIGIESHFLPHVFDRFRQADASTTRRFGGLGLGLAIVRYLVVLHKGSVAVASAGTGSGAAFTITLPLLASCAGPAGSGTRWPVARGAEPLPLSLQGKTILVVEDTVDTLEMMVQTLVDYGATVMKATTAVSALAILRTVTPHLIVSDIGLPDMDGFEFIEKVRLLEHIQGAHIPALAVTAFTRAEDRKRATAAGFMDYMTKPFKPDELVAAASRLVLSA